MEDFFPFVIVYAGFSAANTRISEHKKKEKKSMVAAVNGLKNLFIRMPPVLSHSAFIQKAKQADTLRFRSTYGISRMRQNCGKNYFQLKDWYSTTRSLRIKSSNACLVDLLSNNTALICSTIGILTWCLLASAIAALAQLTPSTT